MNYKGFLLGVLGILATGCTGVGDGGGYGTATRLPDAPSAGSSRGVELGIDVLRASGYAALRGKRVGLITNQTSVDSKRTRTRTILHRAPDVNLVALFTPEHGLDGTEKAAKHISTRRDRVTGLTAYSLYGPTRKPTSSMLSKIDVMVFDLQDIGCRSYTYISTMILAMEACGEAGKEFVVLDRPNPIGGVLVQGPPMEKQWISFVGQLPVPYRHGMTAGELARMANAKGWTGRRCRLTVVPMRGWHRGMSWEDTKLRWVATSPNIPHACSPYYYAATGIFGSLTGGDIGIPGSGPFEYAGGRGFDDREFTRRLSSMNFSGVRFSPYEDDGYAGSRISINPKAAADIVAMNVVLIDEFNKRAKRSLWSTTTGSSKDIFYKVYGSTSLEMDLKRGVNPGRIIEGWKSGNDRFLRERQGYLMY